MDAGSPIFFGSQQVSFKAGSFGVGEIGWVRFLMRARVPALHATTPFQTVSDSVFSETARTEKPFPEIATEKV
jgi:hypothetical protein